MKRQRSGHLNAFNVAFKSERPEQKQKGPTSVPFQTHPFLFLSIRQLRPLSELVKEVQCAGMKRVYLRRAMEQYLSESDSCHCRPCANNGLAVMDGDECKCICKPGTSGLGCEQGAEAEGQPGACQPFVSGLYFMSCQHKPKQHFLKGQGLHSNKKDTFEMVKRKKQICVHAKNHMFHS